jgi:hypothetical protein
VNHITLLVVVVTPINVIVGGLSVVIAETEVESFDIFAPLIDRIVIGE